jgi:hypothetical protein
MSTVSSLSPAVFNLSLWQLMQYLSSTTRGDEVVVADARDAGAAGRDGDCDWA